MNDYKFGNLLCELRMKAKLTQGELAIKLGVTNKAISKWENGKAKPTTDTLKKLAILFNIPIEELLQIKDITKKEISKNVKCNVSFLLGPQRKGGSDSTLNHLYNFK